MKTPLVSIIIPTYNREKQIVKALDSVLSQTYTHWQCLVVDDGSDDETLEVLETYHQKDSRITYFERKHGPKGAPTCRNIGLEKSSGDYVIYLDSDDYLLPFCLEQRVQKVNEYPSCDFLVFPMGEQNNEEIKKREIPESQDYLINFLSASLPWSIMCPIWKASSIKSLNGFTEGYLRFNDPELMIRALVQQNISYKVFNLNNFDSVYVPSSKNALIFPNIVYKSLCLFIPDIITELENNKLEVSKSYLLMYLHLWFKYICIPHEKWNFSQSIALIDLFKKKKILTFNRAIGFKLRLIIYIISKTIFKQPIDKLTNRAYYF